MSENERGIVKVPSLTKEAKTFNSIAIESTIQGMKTAAFMDKQINEAERQQKEARENPIKEETIIPTGAEIRQAREEGEYR